MVCGHNLDHYFETVEKYREAGYDIVKIEDIRDYLINDKPFLILRHDIDLSLDKAFEFARLEKQLDFNSNYYFLLHSFFYNISSPSGMNILKELRKYGHGIGLHVDTRYSKEIHKESKYLELISGGMVNTYTQHLPGLTPDLDAITNQMTFEINAMDYRDKFGIKYLSDSGKHWREGCFCQWIGKRERLHVLTHPVWWNGEKNVFDTLWSLDRGNDPELSEEIKRWEIMVQEFLSQFGKTIYESSVSQICEPVTSRHS